MKDLMKILIVSIGIRNVAIVIGACMLGQLDYLAAIILLSLTDMLPIMAIATI